MGTRRTGYGDTEDEWGRCPGAARCSELTWDACLGNQGEIIRPRFQFWLGRGKKKEKKKEKEAKKKEIELYNASFCNGGSGEGMKD